jgi:hypothetical protein
MTATIRRMYPVNSGAIADERKAQAIVRNATAAFRSALQDAMCLTALHHNALADALLALDDLPSDQQWDNSIEDLRDSYR